MSRNIVAFIFARGGSKGVPGKNIKEIAGKPLIAHAIAAAQGVNEISRIVVSTDDDEIADVARQWGADVPFKRPPELATDDSPEWYSWQHAIGTLARSGMVADLIVSVPTVCPLRTNIDVQQCIARFDRNDADVVVTVIPARANPYYTLIEIARDGVPHLVKEPSSTISGRQQAPKVYQIVAGCYVTTPNFVMSNTGLWSGRLRTHEIPDAHGVDIDTEVDFALAELLFSRRR